MAEMTHGLIKMNATKNIEYKQVHLSLLLTNEHHSGGNKYYKLKLNLERAKAQNMKTLLSFGGAWSNHIHALSVAGADEGFRTIGIIRGEAPVRPSQMLTDAENNGMTLHYVTREQYRQKDTTEFIDELKQAFGNFYLLPEGGSNHQAVLGCQQILNLVSVSDYDTFALPVGTGGTLAGVVSGLEKHRLAKASSESITDQLVVGYSSLKGAFDLEDAVSRMLHAVGSQTSSSKMPAWHICHDYHFGGYGKFPELLRDFLDTFERDNEIKLDPVYTAKMMFGIFDQIDKGLIEPGSRVLVIHTGGLQGRRGYGLT